VAILEMLRSLSELPVGDEGIDEVVPFLDLVNVSLVLDLPLPVGLQVFELVRGSHILKPGLELLSPFGSHEFFTAFEQLAILLVKLFIVLISDCILSFYDITTEIFRKFVLIMPINLINCISDPVPLDGDVLENPPGLVVVVGLVAVVVIGEVLPFS